jgi:hypothetical protein
MPKQTVKKKPVATKKPATKPKAKTTTKPRAKAKPTPAPVVVVDKEVEFPYDEFPWKLIHKERNEKRTCYFQCEEHRKKHIVCYNLNKKDIIFMGYKYENE